MIARYEQMFTERGGITPSDPLEFHLYHLARYWSRLVGFCEQVRQQPESLIDTDLGACVAVASEFAHKMIAPTCPMYVQWQHYWRLTHGVLHERPVTTEDVEAASRAFDQCLSELDYDPWG
jgi:hypothetical protein